MISTREALLEKLVVSLHLNVPERRILGSDCVSVDDVAAVVKRLLERNGLFPPNAIPVRNTGEMSFRGVLSQSEASRWKGANVLAAKQPDLAH